MSTVNIPRSDRPPGLEWIDDQEQVDAEFAAIVEATLTTRWQQRPAHGSDHDLRAATSRPDPDAPSRKPLVRAAAVAASERSPPQIP